jgi:hypothetical protein
MGERQHFIRGFRIVLCIALGCFGFSLINGQILFPELEGATLQQALKDAYRPAFKLGINDAKDTLYLVIERRQDSVSGAYSGFTVDLPNGVDPSQWIFQNGNGINLEHVYPQSKGADEGQAGHSDMHHLFPTRVAVNSARASFPFHDIPDNQTTTWYKGGGSMQSIPALDIDGYSESINGSFEPRESVKGNVARAVFYFYTIYREDADAADPDFFPAQREELCQWHLDDPVDDAELERSAAVAFYQDGKENPFVLDCTAALRAWCPGLSGCVTSQENPDPGSAFFISAYSVSGAIQVIIETEASESTDLSVFDSAGKMLFATKIYLSSGTSEYVLDHNFVPGIYTITARGKSGRMYTTRCVVME